MIRRVALDGEWAFAEAGTEAWKSGSVPGCVQMDLLRLGEAPDPFYRLDEIHMYDLEGKDWVYRKEFDLDERELAADMLTLVFEGIDTYAEIYLNGWYVGRAENMFHPYRFDILDTAREGSNELEVRLASPVNRIRAMERNSPVALRSSCESARPYVRKAQYAYGWDWGPRIAQVGLWRSVYVEAVEGAALAEPFFWTESLLPGEAHVRVSATVLGWAEEELFEGDEIEDFEAEEDEEGFEDEGPNGNGDGSAGYEREEPSFLRAEVRVSLDGRDCAVAEVPVLVVEDESGLEAHLTIPQPDLWWPNGLGGQPLYDVHIALYDGDELMDQLSFRSGIRSVRIVQEADAEGRSFIFEVNGVRVYAKGADWVPADSLLPRLTRDDYYAYIRLARDAHMNMLRIWGGGIYEHPAFYDACDEMGIMVWQDFMYACAQYPDEFDWFQELAREEAVSVVKALRNHPSLVLWCGNNENNWGFDEWWGNGRPKYLGNYVYREILPAVCAEHDPSRPYWVSSPYGGERPNGMDEGDRHSWGVWSNWQDYEGYLDDTGRLISEFGFQAMPTWKTVLSFTAPEDRRILSPVIIGHNKMVNGTERLVRFLVGRIGFPKDLRSFTYLTQFNQAEAIRLGVEHWRSRKFMTSGALYWQLNDCWPVASWSCLDYYRRKKGLYYYSQRFFAPILPLLRHEPGEVLLWAVNDRLEELEARAQVTAYTLAGAELGSLTRTLVLPANGVSAPRRIALTDLGIGYTPVVLPKDGSSTTNPTEVNGELLDAVVYVELEVGDEKYGNYLVFGRFRDLALRPAHVQVEVLGRSIRLSSAVAAFGVFVETEEDVDLSDNCLNLEPGMIYTVECSADPGVVEVLSLTDMVAQV